MLVSLIAAASENNVIGRDGGLPWHLPDDLQFFKRKTTGHPIIMGRKTFESFGAKPLPDRDNIIITRDRHYKAEGCTISPSLDEAILLAQRSGSSEEIFIIGGGEIYTQAMAIADRIYLTRVHIDIEGDVFFPEIDETVWEEVGREEHKADDRHDVPFTFITLQKADGLHREAQESEK